MNYPVHSDAFKAYLRSSYDVKKSNYGLISVNIKRYVKVVWRSKLNIQSVDKYYRENQPRVYVSTNGGNVNQIILRTLFNTKL